MSLAPPAPGSFPRTIVLVDGEHYPPVVRAAIDEIRLRAVVVGAVLLGGGEKLTKVSAPEYGVPQLVDGATPLSGLLEAIDRFAPDAVFDLSDEPVLDARQRLLLVSHALRRGVRYDGSGFSFTPPPRPRLTRKPTLAVIGTGKRTGDRVRCCPRPRACRERTTNGHRGDGSRWARRAGARRPRT